MITRRDLTEPPAEPEGLGAPRRPASLEDLRFKPQPMVTWLHPKVLAGAALEVALSSLFARFADKREIQGGLAPRWWDASGLAEDGSLWLDYASDTGDGFDPTYAVAYMLGRNGLSSPEDGVLKRGRLLVLGGDQVYPSADWKAYHNRFVGPYTAALPYVSPPDRLPYLFALPGNHDWYDGLTSFMRLFCQRGWIGGWKTEQTRSYFAIKLAKPWWLWAVDTQFDTYIDAPQLSYFREMAETLRKDDKVILVTAKPSWVSVTDDCETPQAWETLAMLEDLISRKPAKLALTLTGDLHHYSRYKEPGDQATRHKVTAGGAGAYLSATHPLPCKLRLPDHRKLSKAEGGEHHDWKLETTYPAYGESRGIVKSFNGWTILRHTPAFALFTAVLYGLLAVTVALSVETDAIGFIAPVVLALALCAAMVALAFEGTCKGESTRSKSRRGLFGASHGVQHTVLPVLAGLLITDSARMSCFVAVVSSLVVGAALGSLCGPVVFAVYLRVAHRAEPRWHANEVFAAQSRTVGPRYKHFLRIRIDEGGGATVFALGVSNVPRLSDEGWELVEWPASESDPWLKPSELLVAERFDRFEAV